VTPLTANPKGFHGYLAPAAGNASPGLVGNVVDLLPRAPAQLTAQQLANDIRVEAIIAARYHPMGFRRSTWIIMK
jgi:hypothetical protein